MQGVEAWAEMARPRQGQASANENPGWPPISVDGLKESQCVRVLEKLPRQRTARLVSEEGAETEDASLTG